MNKLPPWANNNLMNFEYYFQQYFKELEADDNQDRKANSFTLLHQELNTRLKQVEPFINKEDEKPMNDNSANFFTTHNPSFECPLCGVKVNGWIYVDCPECFPDKCLPSQCDCTTQEYISCQVCGEWLQNCTCNEVNGGMISDSAESAKDRDTRLGIAEKCSIDELIQILSSKSCELRYASRLISLHQKEREKISFHYKDGQVYDVIGPHMVIILKDKDKTNPSPSADKCKPGPATKTFTDEGIKEPKHIMGFGISYIKCQCGEKLELPPITDDDFKMYCPKCHDVVYEQFTDENGRNITCNGGCYGAGTLSSSPETTLNMKEAKQMHTVKHNDWRIHFNPDLSGDIHLVCPNKTTILVPGKLLEKLFEKTQIGNNEPKQKLIYCPECKEERTLEMTESNKQTLPDCIQEAYKCLCGNVICLYRKEDEQKYFIIKGMD